jgi:hypothetical protein
VDRQATFLLALGLLIAAATAVSVAGWILFARDRRADRGGDLPPDGTDPGTAPGPVEPPEPAAEP